MKQLSAIREMAAAWPYGEVRRYAPPQAYIANRKRTRFAMYAFMLPALAIGALAESGAIAAVVMMALMLFYALLEAALQLPHLSSLTCAGMGAALWFIAFPLVQHYYEG